MLNVSNFVFFFSSWKTRIFHVNGNLGMHEYIAYTLLRAR